MRLKILTLNVWGLARPISQAPNERMEAIAAALPAFDADIIAFQEVWTQEARSRLLAGAARAGCGHRWHREAAFGGSGLLVLSRLPLTGSRFVPFTLNGFPQRISHADYYGGKGFVITTVEAGGGPLAVLVTHLHAGYGRIGDADEYLGHRTAQALEIASALATRPEPLLAAGDFNFEEDSVESRVLRSAGRLRDSAAELDRREATVLADHPFRGPDQPESRIDYVFCRDGRDRGIRPIAMRRVLDEPLAIGEAVGAYSDHAGLLAEFEIGGTPTPLPSPDPGALEAAARVLADGRRQASARRHSNRTTAGTTGAATIAALAALASDRVRSRRGLVRGLLLALAPFGAIAAGGAGFLSEVFGREELQGYDAVSDQLARLRAIASSQTGLAR